MESSAVDLATYVRTPLAAAHVARLRQLGEVVHFAPDDTLLAFGAPNEAFFYIVGPANSDSKLKQLERQGLGATPVA